MSLTSQGRPRTGALLLMAGTGERFGSEIPKQFHRLSGRSLFLYAFDALVASRAFDEILLICHPKWVECVQQQVGSAARVIPGGVTRQESSYIGLTQFQHPLPEIVLIHDAVRPFLTQTLIEQNMLKAIQHGAVDTCIPSTDTLVYTEGQELIAHIPPREHYLRGQTPQTFLYSLLLKAHEEALHRGLTHSSDDCRLVSQLGFPIHVVQGHEHNLKITSDLDLFLAEQLLRTQATSPSSHTPQSLQGKRFALLGGTGGIGQALAHQLTQEGAIPLLLSRSSPTYPIDLTQPSTISTLFARLFEEHGLLDGLINCAGLFIAKPLASLSLQEIEQLLDINLKGLILSCQHARIAPQGHIINFASSSFFRGRKEMGVYSSTKAAVVNFTQALAEERPDLRVHAIIPHRAKTPMRRSQFPEESSEELLDPVHIAETVVHLLKEPHATSVLVEVKKEWIQHPVRVP